MSGSSKINSTQVDQLEDSVCSSGETRQVLYLELTSNILGWNVDEIIIRNAIIKSEFKRCLSRKKPPLSEENRRFRKAWVIMTAES